MLLCIQIFALIPYFLDTIILHVHNIFLFPNFLYLFICFMKFVSNIKVRLFVYNVLSSET